MVKICDAIMGSGKSSAAITYINEHPDEKIIYVTPYLAEAHRISQACPNTTLFEPQKNPRYKGSKTLHTIGLVEKGKSVATTHQAFVHYPPELVDMIREKGYVLIVDESVDVLEAVEQNADDVQMAIDANYLEPDGEGGYRCVKSDYKGKSHADLFRALQTRDVSKVSGDGRDDSYFYWQLPPSLFTAFKEVYVLTYLFEGQDMAHFLKMHEIPYEYIFIAKDDGGVFRFSEERVYIPDYVRTIKDKIHILDHKRMNDVGDDRFALSLSWFDKYPDKVDVLRRNVDNLFKNLYKVKKNERIWSTYTDYQRDIAGKGYGKAFVPFNQKSSNDYRDCVVAAYCVNLYMNVGRKIFYREHGVEVDEDMYALSNMVQWIWRTAIRDGKEVVVYIPSSRMRKLLVDWMDQISEEANAA